MTTVIFNTKSKAAKVMIEYLKTQPYAKIIEEKPVRSGVQKSSQETVVTRETRKKNTEELSLQKEPNAQTKRAIHDVQKGKVTRCDSLEDMLSKLKS